MAVKRSGGIQTVSSLPRTSFRFLSDLVDNIINIPVSI